MKTVKTDSQRFVFEGGYQDYPNETDIEGAIVVDKTIDLTDMVLEGGVLVDRSVENAAARVEAAREATIREYSVALDAHLDGEAHKLGYDSIETAVTYADEPSVAKFQDEGKALRAWRSLCYDAGYSAMTADPTPTLQEFLSSLPLLTIAYRA